MRMSVQQRNVKVNTNKAKCNLLIFPPFLKFQNQRGLGKGGENGWEKISKILKLWSNIKDSGHGEGSNFRIFSGGGP